MVSDVSDSGELHALDQKSRNRIAEELWTTLFVTAGAGSGKTTALVSRVRNLLLSGVVSDVRRLAAISFTEKAAGELLERIRSDLAETLDGPLDDLQRRRISSALERLDLAPISTLHAFAARILREHSVAAGLPAKVTTLDEIAQSARFERTWEHALGVLLDSAEFSDDLSCLFALGVKVGELHDIMVSLNRRSREMRAINWFAGSSGVDLRGSILRLRVLLQGRAREVADDRQQCTTESDTLLAALDRHGEAVLACQGIDDASTFLSEVASLPVPKATRLGRKENWPDIASIREGAEMFRLRLEEALRELCDLALRRILSALARSVEQERSQRIASGELTFDDQISVAEELLRRRDVARRVREQLYQSFDAVLIDEFQDTDAAQMEILLRVVSNEDPPNAQWHELPVPQGRLFFVGDPMQSIYRFRGAQPELFFRTRDAVLAPELVELDTNFRSCVGIIEFINQSFSSMTVIDASGATTGLPGVQALRSVRPDPTVGPPVSIIDIELDGSSGGTVSPAATESEAIAQAIVRAVGGGGTPWSVMERDGVTRDAGYNDIVILIPTRSVLGDLERALTSYEIPYVAGSAAELFRNDLIAEFLIVLHALATPDDALTLYSALRTSLIGCTDQELYDATAGRDRVTWSLEDPDGVLASLPRQTLARLLELRGASRTMGLSEFVEYATRSFHLAELGREVDGVRGLLMRSRYLVERARAFEASVAGTLPAFLNWLRRQRQEDRVSLNEITVPETDERVVRIMTVHQSKGLEFPIVMVAGQSKQIRRGQWAGVALDDTGDLVFRCGGSANGVESENFKAYVDKEKAEDMLERYRVAYVAYTRARDHLVVSFVRSSKGGMSYSTMLEEARLTARKLPWVEVIESVPATQSDTAVASMTRSAQSSHLPDRDSALARFEALRSASFRRSSLGITSLESDDVTTAEGEIVTMEEDALRLNSDVALSNSDSAMQAQRVGQAVHEVLALHSLEIGVDVEHLCRRQCAVHGILDAVEMVKALVNSAVRSQTVQVARTRRHFKEMFLSFPIGDGRVAEGYVDLLYEDDDGLVVVDYKTTSRRSDSGIPVVDEYRDQAAGYVLALRRITGLPVSKVILLFLSSQGAYPQEVPDLDERVLELASLLRTPSS